MRFPLCDENDGRFAGRIAAPWSGPLSGLVFVFCLRELYSGAVQSAPELDDAGREVDARVQAAALNARFGEPMRR
ncbi:hypothetical protein [Paraburkholderia tropica]|uniref:hypothetical protein n=2 Tax=Burkholderiales TaxID=80840 RepID=UPI00159126E8|nr:hypothetical protein [Paraburkholderia tropica]MBB3003618.1 hypothetical protein [Paraburkholderia tropica]